MKGYLGYTDEAFRGVGDEKLGIHIKIMEKKMEATIMGYIGFRV